MSAIGSGGPALVFVDTFNHPPASGGGSGPARVDEILLEQPAVIRELHVIDAQTALPIAGQTPFQGASAPHTFSLEFWALITSGSGDSKSASDAPTRYVRLTDNFQYRFNPHSPCRIALSSQIATTHLVVRGSYDSLSLALYATPSAAVPVCGVWVYLPALAASIDPSITDSVFVLCCNRPHHPLLQPPLLWLERLL